jgi:hypothetical protein
MVRPGTSVRANYVHDHGDNVDGHHEGQHGHEETGPADYERMAHLEPAAEDGQKARDTAVEAI